MQYIRLAALIALALVPVLGSASETAATGKDWSHHTGKIEFIIGCEKGLAESRFTGKPLMAFCTTTWCGWCKKLAGEAFRDDKVVEAVSEFVPVLVDGDVEKDVCGRFAVRGFPAIRFLGSDGKVLGAVDGYVPADRFLSEVRAARAKLGKEIKLAPEYVKLLKARKDMDKAMEKRDFAAALTAAGIIGKAGHEGPESRAAEQARQAMAREAKVDMDAAEALAKDGRKGEALRSLLKVAQVFKGLPEAKEASEKAEALQKDLQIEKRAGPAPNPHR